MLDSITRLLLDDPDPVRFAQGLRDALDHRWDPARLRAHANDHSEPALARRLREVVSEVGGAA